MAKKEDQKVEKKAINKKTAGSAGKFKFILFLILIGPATAFMLPTVVLMLIGLIPTYVALATDTDPQKSGATSVSMMNLAGLTPFIIDLWTKGQTMPNAFHILSETTSWLIILGAAGIGQLIVYAIPQAITTLTLTHTEARIKILRKNLDMLKEFWGPDVATTRPIDKITQS